MSDPASKASIRKFVKAYRGQVDVSEIAEDLDSFKNFNEFFYRKLKPGVRPIAAPDDDTVLVSAADCRLMTYETVQQSQQFWIKVCLPVHRKQCTTVCISAARPHAISFF